MALDVSSFIERYQLIYEKDPSSKVFAPLAEAYRRMGLIDEAIDLAKSGVKRHPQFASGRVALGKCYFQKNQFLTAIDQLKVAVGLSPENILAHQILAQCYIKLKKPTEALNAYKMVLFLNPHDENIFKTVRDLEAKVFTGVDIQDLDNTEDDYSLKRLAEIDEPQNGAIEPTAPISEELDRDLALWDARFDRGDWAAAKTQIQGLLGKFSDHLEVIKRKEKIDSITNTDFDIGELISPLEKDEKVEKINKLQAILSAIESRRKA